MGHVLLSLLSLLDNLVKAAPSNYLQGGTQNDTTSQQQHMAPSLARVDWLSDFRETTDAGQQDQMI